MGSKCGLYRFHCLVVSLLFLSILSSTHLRLGAEGRPSPQQKNPFSQGQERVVSEEESKVMVRARIGSRPPRCERRCSSCSHCEAIQVPTNPQVKFGTKKNTSLVSNIAYARGDDNSNYKPMSWKCKCGDFIFNP